MESVRVGDVTGCFSSAAPGTWRAVEVGIVRGSFKSKNTLSNCAPNSALL